MGLKKGQKPDKFLGRTLRRHFSPALEDIIEEISNETEYTEFQISAAIGHFFDWNWVSLHNAEYAEYYWKNFGTIKFNTTEKWRQDEEFLKQHYEFVNRRKLQRDTDITMYVNRELGTLDNMIIKESQELANKISKEFTPEQFGKYKIYMRTKRSIHLPNYGYWVGGNQQKGQWNIDYMSTLPTDQLQQFYNNLKSFYE